ncbi:MAG TPA: hypothetical protein VMT54_19995 [Candidatus Cybelea sp.]|nr:hypothetical protein [Candidatus Cybelea sp.]
MISLAEFEIALRGLARLARFDAGFAGFFDLSREGAKRSFRLALWLLPVYLFLSHLNANWPDGTDMVRVVAAELICYALSWVAFPLLLLTLTGARLLDREGRVYGVIAVYNWLSVLGIGLQLPIELVAYWGLDPGWHAALYYAVVLFIEACAFFAFKRLLGVGIEIAAVLALADLFLMQVIITSLLASMAHAPMF